TTAPYETCIKAIMRIVETIAIPGRAFTIHTRVIGALDGRTNQPLVSRGAKVMRAKLLAIGVSLGFVLAATAATAHPKLTSSVPASEGMERAATGSKEIRLNFSEGVVARFSCLELQDESGKPIPTGTATIDANDKKQLVI